MLRSLFVAATLAASGCATAPQAPASNLQLIDYTDDFAAVYDRTEALDAAARVAAFKAHFAPLLPGFYDHRRLGLPDATRYDARFAQGLAAFPEQRAGIAEVSRDFASLLAPAERSFEQAFGPMTGFRPVLLVVSLGEFDGGTRELGGTTYLMFGADMIARIHAGRNIQPFFHHELFHLLHGRTFTECDAVWCNVWSEGLATYVAHRLNPAASDHELLLTLPEPIREPVDRNRREAICAVAERLESSADADNRALFSFARLNERLPPRFGYYVGYLVAAEAGRTRSLQQLAALRNEEVRPLVEQSLRGLADCA